MSNYEDERRSAIEREIEREEALAEKFFEKYQETGSPSAEKTAERHAMIADLLRKGRDADRHANNRAWLATRVMGIETQDLLKCGREVRYLQERIAEGDFS